MPAPIATQGDLCLVNGGVDHRRGNAAIDVGGNVYISGPVVDSGPRTGSTATGWTNPTYGRTNDGNYATNAITKQLSGVPTVGATETVSGFGFAIPAAAQIKGITVSVQRNASSSSSIRDNSVLLQKTAAVTAPTNKAVTTSSWSTSDTVKIVRDYNRLVGSDLDAGRDQRLDLRPPLPGEERTTRPRPSRHRSTTSRSPSPTSPTRTASVPRRRRVTSVQVGGTTGCKYNLNAAHKPCTATDHVNATLVDMTKNTDMQMPDLELQTWFDAARPGPKHPCTNAGNNFAPLAFDNDGSADSNDSQTFDNSGLYDMTPLNRDYDCQVIENGILVGRLAWNHSTHVLSDRRHDLLRR